MMSTVVRGPMIKSYSIFFDFRQKVCFWEIFNKMCEWVKTLYFFSGADVWMSEWVGLKLYQAKKLQVKKYRSWKKKVHHILRVKPPIFEKDSSLPYFLKDQLQKCCESGGKLFQGEKKDSVIFFPIFVKKYNLSQNCVGEWA